MAAMTRALAVTLVLAVLAAGCGDEEEQGAPPKDASAPEQTTTPAGEESATVAIKGFTYDPARVTVRQGGSVTWKNQDASNHTVTFASKGPEDVGNLRDGRSATVTFDDPGTYRYICEFHPGMAGRVEVR